MKLAIVLVASLAMVVMAEPEAEADSDPSAYYGRYGGYPYGGYYGYGRPYYGR